MNTANDPFIVLAIDPGYDRLGVAVVKQDKNEISLLHSDCIVTNRKFSHDKRLGIVGGNVADLIKRWKPHAIAIEELFFSKNRTTALKVAEALGIIQYEATLANIGVHLYKPVEVKVAVTGYGRSEKDQVMSMVMKLVKMKPIKRLDDEYDAIAVGLTHLARRKHNAVGLSPDQ